MLRIFSKHSPYIKRAKWAAALWTLLIFILCLLPGKELPSVNVPFIDKWTHFVLFGVFAVLWLCAYPGTNLQRLFFIFIIAATLGWLIEWLQGYFISLGRSKDIMDSIADAVGALLGIALYYILAHQAQKKGA